MGKLLSILILFLCLAGSANAQLTQSQVDNDINTMLQSCGNRCNTAASLRSLLDIMAAATFQAQGANGLSISGTPTVGSVLAGTGGFTAAWTQIDVTNTFDVTKYGASCNGTTVDYGPVQAALAGAAAVGGGTVLFPPGKSCNIGANTLTIPGNYVTLDGGVQGTNLLFSNVSANDILIGNGSGLPGYYQTRLRNLTISDSARTSGQAVQVLGASQPSLYNVQIIPSDATVALWAQQFNDMFVDQSFIRGTVQLFSPANNAQRSDQFTISNTLIRPNTPSACWNWDGMVQTVNAYFVVMLNCTIGLVVSNNSHNASFYPAFGTFVNMQVDGATAQAVWIQGGYNIQFVGSDFNGSGATSNIPIVQVDPDAGAGGSITRQVKFIGGGVHDTYGKCLVTNSVDFSLIGTDVYDCGKNAANTYTAIEISQAAGTSNALISSAKIGFATTQGSTSNYGVTVDSTVTGAVLLTSNNFAGNATGAVNDATAAKVAVVVGGVDFNGAPLPFSSPLLSPLPLIGALSRKGTVCISTTNQLYYSATTC